MIRKQLVGWASLLFMLICGFRSFGQHIEWNTAPRTGFVFEINNHEAQKLLTRASPDTIFNGLLHSMIDTFAVEKGWTNRPDKGHFILARIVENKLHCEYTSVFPYQVFLLNEYDALSLQVLDLEGNVREDAKVKFKLRRLRIDPDSKTYRLENAWFHGDHRIVTVELDGFRSVFNVEKHEVPSWFHDYDDDEGPSFYSYMITDKNKYKPNEKVRFKSFALSQSRAPVRRDLELWLINSGKSKKIAEVEPHRPGSFAGEFHLHDSLNLILDRDYRIQLREKRGRIVATCHFKYEDYELFGNTLEVALATEKQFHPADNELTITASDVNGLIQKDARASVLVKTQTIRETFQPLVILPDTLFYTEVDLNPDGPTVVPVPSGLFGKSNTTYAVKVSVLNSESQRMERAVSATHYYSRYELTTRFSNDSIVYAVLNNGEPMKGVPMRLKHSGEKEAKEITLPYKEKLNPVVSTIQLQGDIVSKIIHMRELVPRLELEGGIQKDSFNVMLHNPQRLELSWYIYQGSVLLEKGFGEELEYKSLITDRSQTYYVELLYSFGGQEHIKRSEYHFREDYLDVSIEVPERVYPGQQVEATIHVLDQLGNPVNGVDLTALAVTGKLNYHLPDLPYYGNSSSPRSKKAHYTKSDVNKRTAVLDLDYKKWEKRAGLDTMKYYQYTYPGAAVFSHTVEVDDSTQFAPFVMQDGTAKQVYVIEVNRKPAYYSWVDQPEEFSFYVSPSRPNQISLRLYDRVLVLDSVVFEAGKKTIMSLDLDQLPKGVKVHKLYTPVKRKKRRRPQTFPTFTPTEINRHIAYVSSFKRRDGNAYLEADKAFTPLFHAYAPSRKGNIVVGPVTPGKQTFTTRGLVTTYAHTGGFNYAFEDNIVYKLDADKLIPDVLHDNSFRPITVINDRVMTKKQFLEYKPDHDSRWHARVIDLVDHATRISALLPDEKEASGIAAFLFEDCKTGKIVSPCQNHSGSYLNGSKADYFTIPRGCHNAIVVYNNGKYLKMDSIELNSHSHVVINLNHSTVHPADSLSETWLSTPSNNCYGTLSLPSKTISMRYPRHALGNVRGTIYDDTNVPLPGATIVVKGTAYGTVSDVDGHFSLDIPESRATLVVSFIGYTMKEIEVQIGSDVTLYMEADIQQLQEVVVIGYGEVRVRGMSSMSSALTGRLSGVTLSQPDEDADAASREEQHEPDPETLRKAEEQLYQELLTLNSIRSNFSDVGFWEPRLFTDKRGESKFTITFPDDITRWDATVYAMNRRLQTGTARSHIRSYKPLMAELHVPRFLTRGDSAMFLGKVLNYTADKNINGTVSWSGAQTDFQKDIQFTGFHTDHLPVYATTTDSLTTSYRFTRDDGYLDGEERTIPVIDQGVLRAEGTLSILKNGDNLHVKASAKEKITVEILDNPLDIYAGEVKYLVNYRYACNEQLASKLIGLVNHKLLMQYEDKPFRNDRDVNKIIARLLKNQNQEFLWSWWDVSPNTSYWMSAHILRALKSAQDAGFKVGIDIENIARKAAYKFDMLDSYALSDVDLLHALASWGAELNYAAHVARIDSIITKKENIGKTFGRHHYRYSMLKEKLLLQEVRQMTGLRHHPDSLLQYKKDGIMGDIHFSDDKPASYWHQDDLAVNAIAYRIVKRDSLLHDLLVPMQMYFLNSRKKGGWNTYHSSNVLMTVLPDLLAQGVSKGKTASVTLRGTRNETLEEFPFRVDLEPEEELHIRKDSGLPLYFMQYVEERVTEAKRGVEGFSIKTTLNKGNMNLEAGEPVVLTVEVDVDKDASAEYVMIEVPIPGACSYGNKEHRRNPVETHREYFQDRTVIFCERMQEGKYLFSIELLPRFPGRYLINPAQVSLMYVPVVNANTNMKAVRVE